MRNLPNIEKSGFRKGVYVGYCSAAGFGAWTITKTSARHPANRWQARHGTVLLFARTLADLSKQLNAFTGDMKGSFATYAP